MLDHAVPLATIALVTESLKIGQMIASSLGEGKAMMDLEPDADSADATTDARKMIAL